MKKVLVIEDDPVARTVYQRYLRANGFEVDVAFDGTHGLERVTEFEPDAILLDLMMPGLSGIDVLRSLRAHESYRDLPVVIVSSACVPALTDRAFREGANAILDKTHDTPAAIVAMLQRVMGLDSASTPFHPEGPTPT